MTIETFLIVCLGLTAVAMTCLGGLWLLGSVVGFNDLNRDRSHGGDDA